MSIRPRRSPLTKIPLRILLILALLAQIILAAGLVGYLSILNEKRAVNDVAEQLRNEITARIEGHLHTFLQTPHQINRINANAIRQGLPAADDPQALERYFWEQIQVFDSVTSIYFGNTKGGLMDAGREGAGGPLYVIVTDNFESGPFRKYATDAEGNRTELLTTVPEFDARNRSWYTKAVEKGSAVCTEPYILFTGQDLAISSSSPVYDEQHNLLGVVANDIFISHLRDFLQSLNIGKTGQSFIIERSGLLVASSTDEAPFIDLDDETQQRLQASESEIPLIRMAARHMTEHFGHYDQISETQHLEFKIDGQRQFLQVAPFQNKYGIDWLIVVVVPEADFMGRIQANRRITISLIAAISLGAIIASIITAQSITEPIQRLNVAAQSLADGEWEQSIPSTFIHELNEMISSFNRMAKRLTAEIAERERVEQALRRRALEQEKLREAALTMTTTLERGEVIERILAQLQEVAPYDTASVQLLRDEHLEIVGGRGFPNLEQLLGVHLSLDPQINPGAKVIHTRETFVVGNAQAEYAGFQGEPHAAANIHSWMGVPMLVGDNLIGLIALDKHEVDFYTREHARLAETFAAQAAIAVANSRFFHAERDQRELAEALAEASAAVNSSLELEAVLDHILDQVERVIAGETFNIMLVEDNKARIVRWRGYEEMGIDDKIGTLSIPITEYTSMVKMMKDGEPVIISDTSSEADWVTREGFEWLRSYIGAPICVGGKVVGFLNADSATPGRFDADDAQRLGAFADHAAIAIENAQLYQELEGYAEQLELRVEERTAELQAQYARLEAILRSVTDGIMVTDGRGNIIQANPVAQRWIGQTLSPEETEQLWDNLHDLVTRAEERPEKVLELAGLDLELISAPISAPDIKDAAVVAIHDVSHLKALDRMRSRFITNISHEFRTPIATINAYVYLLRKHPERYEEYLDIMEKEIELLIKLVNDIMTIAQLSAGREEMKTRPMSLNQLTSIVCAGWGERAQNQDIALSSRLTQTNPLAMMDADWIKIVLENLLSNALLYTPGGGSVTVSTDEEIAQGRHWATLSVTDTGIGIPHEDQPHIFKRFFRGDEPRQMQVTGTGLGLAIVKEIIELHGGWIEVKSQEGAGSKFTVWLPIAE